MSASWNPKVVYYKTRHDKLSETLFECLVDELVDQEVISQETLKKERSKQRKECIKLLFLLPFNILFCLLTLQITKAKLLKNLFFLSLKVVLN